MLAVYLLMPVAYYPVYRVTASDPSVSAYLAAVAVAAVLADGPQWFLWQLRLNIVAAGLYKLAPRMR